MPTNLTTTRRINAVIGLILIISSLLVWSHMVEASGDHWICQAAAIYSFGPNSRQAEWDGSTWRVLETHDPGNPADDEWQYWRGDEPDTGLMYANPELNEAGPAYMSFMNYDLGIEWRFAFIDTISTNENGRWGMHHSCPQGPVVIYLNPPADYSREGSHD